MEDADELSLFEGIGDSDVSLSEDDEVVPLRLPRPKWLDLDVDQGDEGNVGAINGIRETALEALWWQRDISEHHVAIGLEHDPFAAPGTSRMNLH